MTAASVSRLSRSLMSCPVLVTQEGVRYLFQVLQARRDLPTLRTHYAYAIHSFMNTTTLRLTSSSSERAS